MIIDQITNQPIIETERFILRPLRKSDAGLLDCSVDEHGGCVHAGVVRAGGTQRVRRVH